MRGRDVVHVVQDFTKRLNIYQNDKVESEQHDVSYVGLILSIGSMDFYANCVTISYIPKSTQPTSEVIILYPPGQYLNS